MRIVAKAPCRVDLAGGTLDIWPLYLFHSGAVTVNVAIDRYTSCVIETLDSRAVRIESKDLGFARQFESMDDLAACEQPELALAAHLLRFFAPRTGLRMITDSEAPAGAGIAGSSSLMIAATSALTRLTGAGYDLEKIREVAQNIEAQIIRVPTGCQDYYPALYGGVSAIELGVAGIRRVCLPLDPNELNERMVVAYTGAPRNSGINNWEVMKAHIDGEQHVVRNFDEIAAIAAAMREAVTRADWDEAGRLLREEWAHRRRNAPGITTPLIDRLIESTRDCGAMGGKVCGAGGGGCVFFLVEPESRERVSATIRGAGAEVLPVRVARQSVEVKVEGRS